MCRNNQTAFDPNVSISIYQQEKLQSQLTDADRQLNWNHRQSHQLQQQQQQLQLYERRDRIENGSFNSGV